MTPVQPPDETPLPITSTLGVTPGVFAAVPGLQSDISSARQDIIDASTDHITSLSSDIGDARKDVAANVLAAVGAIDQELYPHYDAVLKQLNKTIKKVDSAIEGAYADLHAEGVVTPITMSDTMDDLTDTTGRRIADRFSAVRSTSDAATSFAICPPGSHNVISADGLSSICVLDTVRTPPPPPPPPTDTPPPPSDAPPLWYLGRIVSECPPGTAGLVDSATGRINCVPAFIPPSPPPPFGPPPPPPPEITACEGDTVETVIVRCRTTPPPPVVYRWWITVDCSDCHRPKACVWRGVHPPTVYTGILLPQIYDSEPSNETVDFLARECARPFLPPSPPPSPPPPPFLPPSPPPPASPPPCETDRGPLSQLLSLVSIPSGAICSSTVVPDESIDDGLFSTCHEVMTRTIRRRSGSLTDSDNNRGNPEDSANVVEQAAKALLNVSFFGLGSLFSGETASSPVEAYTLFTSKINSQTDVVTRNAIDKYASVESSQRVAFLNTILAIGMIDRVEKLSGIPLEYFTHSLTYDMRYMSPQFIPDQPDIDALYINGKIVHDTWVCMTRMQGNKPNYFSAIRDMKRTRPGPNELVSLWRRDETLDGAELVKRMRDVGVQDDKTTQEYIKLSEQVPQAPDIVRFMVRDVFDTDVVAKYDLDNGFDKKYTANSERLGFAAGLSNETARYEWRAHWRVPSDTALYDMIHKLNPRRPEIADWDGTAASIGVEGATFELGPRPATFTTDELKYALKINDNLPSFVDKLVAIQYRPITNTDASRMYEIGYINENQFKWYVVANGYTEKNSEDLVGFYKAQRTKRISNDTGIWTGRKILAAYKAGTISHEQCDTLLADKFVDPIVRRNIIDSADLEQKSDVLLVKLKALKQKFMFGEYDSQQLGLMLQGTGMDAMKINSLVDQWQALRNGRAKEPKVAMLCQWYTRGYITFDDYIARLHRLGFSRDDADNIAATCSSDNQLKTAKAAAAAALTQRKAVEKQIRDARTAAKDQLDRIMKLIKIEEERLKALRMGVPPANIP